MKVLGYDIEGGGWGGLTESLAVARAKAGFDFLVAQAGLYSRYVDAMKAANPNIELLAYANGTHTSNPDFPEQWYMHDSSGKRLRSAPPWSINFTMMPIDTHGPTATVKGITASSWNEWKLKDIERIIATSGYDGVYVDELGTGSLSSRADGIGEAIDPRTNKPWTRTDYMDDIGAYLSEMNALMPFSQSLTVNGLGTNYRFYGRPYGHRGPFVTDYGSLTDGATEPLLAADMAAAELYMRGPTQDLTKFPPLDWWTCEQAMTVEAGPKLMALTKTWTVPPSRQPTMAELTLMDRWHRFSLSSFLNKAHPEACYYFTYRRADTVTAYHPWWGHADKLGGPTGDGYQLTSKMWRRQYQGGFILTNPYPTPASTRLTRAFRLLDGTALAANSTVTVGPYDGQVLVRA